MDYSLTTVFVVPVGNTLPTTGSTQNLTAGQFGVFKDDARTIATNGNIATASFIQFFQGHEATIGATIGSKPSDKIKASKVKKWYKVTGNATAANEIQVISDFTAKCGESLTVSLRAHSSYIDTISFNGLTRSVTVKTPCCDCGADPCDTVDAEALVDLILAQIAQDNAAQVGASTLNISTFFTFTKVGTGSAATLVVESKPLTVYGQPCDVAANPYEYDRIWFNLFVYTGPATTQDFFVANNCESAGTVTVTQRSSFPRGTSTDVKQAEFDYFSYQSPFKHLFRMNGYNEYFESFVTDGTIYDQYVIQFDELLQDDSWTPNLKEDEKVILFIPQSQTSTIETMLVTYLGAIVNESGNAISTTTTSTLIP
jgi:hypothetical protein